MTEFIENKNVYWLALGTIKPGQESAFRILCAKMVESTKAQSGALHYEWSISDDGTYFHIFERYADSEAVKVHREQSAKLVKLLFTTIADLKAFTIYGNPSEEVKELYSSRHPVVMKPLNGFSKN